MNDQKLERCLGFASAFFVLVGSVIGSGVFLVAAEISQAVTMPLAALGVWVGAGLISLAGALIFSELGAMYPQAGGQYVFLRKAFHPLISFLFGWALVLVIQTGSIAAVAVGFAKFLSQLVDLTIVDTKIVASLLVIALTYLNSRGTKKGAYFLDGVTSLKIVAIVGLVGVCFMSPNSLGVPLTISALGEGSWNFSALGVALIASFWAYDGWTNLSYMAGEIKHPRRNIPLASIAGILFVTALYFVVNLAYYRMLPVEAISQSGFVAADAVKGITGAWGVKALAVLVMLSALGCVNGLVLTGARVIYAMGKDGSLPSVCAKVNAQTHSPNVALLVQCIWSLVLVWSGSYDQLFTYVVFAAFLFYGLTALAVIRLRISHPHTERPYKVPLYPVLPLAYLAFIAWFMVNSLIEKPIESLAGLGILAVGVAVFYASKLRTHRRALVNE